MKTVDQQLVHLVLTLAKAGDLDVLPNTVRGAQLVIAKEIAELIRNFNYVDSVTFEELTRGKSQSVVEAWRRKFQEPKKRTEIQEEFYSHLRRILGDGEVEKYLPERAAIKVASIRVKLEALNAI